MATRIGPFPTFNPDYLANAVTFDGSTTYVSRASISGASATAVGTISFWVKLANITTDYTIFENQNGPISITLNSVSDRFNIFVWDCGFTGKLQIQSFAVTDTNWHHIATSWDLSASYAKVFIDGVDNTSNAIFGSNTVGCWTALVPIVGGTNPPSVNAFQGSLADVYVNTAEKIDLASKITKFIKNTHPVYLGANGELPSGNQPSIFLTGQSSVFANNVGSGGSFTVSGTLGDDLSGP